MNIQHFTTGLFRATLCLFVTASACGPSPAPTAPQPAAKAKPSSVAPAEVVAAPEPAPRKLPSLKTGSVAVVRMAPVAVSLSDAEQTGEIQTLRVEFQAGPDWLNTGHYDLPHVRITNAAGAQPRSFFEHKTITADGPSGTLWLRRRVTAADASAPLAVSVYAPTRYGDALEYQFTLDAPKWSSKPKLFRDYLAALGRYGGHGPVGWLLRQKDDASVHHDGGSRAAQDWSEAMAMLSSYESIEAALMWNDQLRLSAKPSRATIPITTLRRPNLQPHPWKSMLRALPEVQYTEPLAELTPASFYYARARNFDALQIVLDETDRFITPAVRLLEGERSRKNLSERYRLQLGLPSDGLSRLLGPALVESLALVGSDPFLRQGSDLTLIVQPKDLEGLRSALALKRAKLAATHPLSASKFTHAGVTVERFASADGMSVNQHSASVRSKGGQTVFVVSNSPGALRQVIDTILGTQPNLASEVDFQYMMRRDPNVREQLLVYIGDSFVQASMDPARRVLDGRRQLAKLELSAPGYAALVHGWVFGRSPTDAKELSTTPWFERSRLVHTSGEKISFEVGSAPRSSWGTPAMLTPIIDLPRPKQVTPEEKAAYESLANRYEARWTENIDPIAIRVQPQKSREETTLDLHVRVLPVMNSANYRELRMLADGGDARTQSLPHGLSAALALGERSPLRELLSGQGKQFLGRNLQIDWLGEWVALGMGDRVEFAENVARTDWVPRVGNAEPEIQDEEDVLRGLPLYLALDIKSRTGAGLFMGLLRKFAQDAAGDVFSWAKDGDVNGTDVVRVSSDDIEVFYAITKQRLIASFSRDQIEDMIESEGARGEGPQRAQHPPQRGAHSAVDEQAAQLSFQLNPTGVGSALMVALAWMFEQEQREESEKWFAPELLLCGAPELADDAARLEALSLAYTGAFPVTPDGASFRMGESGVTDPARGSAHAPHWPEIPVPGSPLAQVLAALEGAESELSVDEEPGNSGEQSLRTRLRITLSNAAPR